SFARELVDARSRCATRRAAPIYAQLTVTQVIDQHEEDVRLLGALRLWQCGSRVSRVGATEQPCGDRAGTGRLEERAPAQHDDLLEHHSQSHGWDHGGIRRRAV